MSKRRIGVRGCCVAAWVILLGAAPSVWAHDEGEEDPKSGAGGAGIVSGPFAEFRANFASSVSLATMGGGTGNDVWGWTDPLNGREYAIMGRSTGTSFVDVTDPFAPVFLGNLPSHVGSSVWRDVKVYDNYAFVVADQITNHGMQVFDLTRLRGVVTPQTFTEDAHYAGFSRAHNLVINEATGFAYAVGTNVNSGGLHFIDISNPLAPVAAGAFSADGYTHDAQAVVYTGPDLAYVGRELVFASNEDTLTIVDVTNKGAPVQVSRTTYTGRFYTHQGWLTEDHKYFIFDDELDEMNIGGPTPIRTHVFDVQDVNAPVYKGFYQHDVVSIDHNLYVHNGLVYEADYTAGLRVLRPIDLSTASFELIAWIDTHPPTNSDTSFNGAWSVYPFFSSGTIIISDINAGLIVLKLSIPTPGAAGATAAGLAWMAMRRRRRTRITWRRW